MSINKKVFILIIISATSAFFALQIDRVGAVTNAPSVWVQLGDAQAGSPNHPGDCGNQVGALGVDSFDSNNADCVRVQLNNPDTYTDDFRFCFYVVSAASCTPWASEGGGPGPLVIGGNSIGYVGAVIQTRAAPPGITFTNVGVGVQFAYRSNGSPCGASSGPTYSFGSLSPWAYGAYNDDDPGCGRGWLQVTILNANTPTPTPTLPPGACEDMKWHSTTPAGAGILPPLHEGLKGDGGVSLPCGATRSGYFTVTQPSLVPGTYNTTFSEVCDNCEVGYQSVNYNLTYVVAPNPDYAVDNLSVSGILLPGQLLSFSGRVSNPGAENAASSTTTSITLDDAPLSTATTNALAMTQNETESWPNAWIATAGPHSFEICADAGNGIVESNEANNCDSQYFEVSSPLPRIALTENMFTLTCFNGPCANGSHSVGVINSVAISAPMDWVFDGIVSDPYGIIILPMTGSLNGGTGLTNALSPSPGSFNYKQPTTTPGSYTAIFRMRCTNCEVGFEYATYTLTYIVEPINDARFISRSAPAIVTTGQTAAVSVTMQNCHASGVCTGGDLKPWYGEASGTPYRLGAQDPQDDPGVPPRPWGLKRINMPSGAGFKVDPGQSRTFSFNITAPSCIAGQPGCAATIPGCTPTDAYHMNCIFRWKMVQEGVEWFGESPSVTIQVKANEPPVVSNITATYIPCSTASNVATIGWTYTDPDGNPQSAWRIELADDAFGTWTSLYDTGIIAGSGNNQTITWGTAPRNKTIKIRVTVWDSGSPVLASAPVIQNGIFFALLHDAPRPDFCWPYNCNYPPTYGPKPKVNLPTNFTDRTQCVDSGGSAVACRRWSWNFGDASPPPSVDSTTQNPSHTYLNIGSYNVNLIAEDNEGYSCSISKPIRIERPIPIWREVSPGDIPAVTQ